MLPGTMLEVTAATVHGQDGCTALSRGVTEQLVTDVVVTVRPCSPLLPVSLLAIVLFFHPISLIYPRVGRHVAQRGVPPSYTRFTVGRC